jgi:hypothetical protein
VTVDEMTIDDAINVANVIGNCLPTDADRDLRELALDDDDSFTRCRSRLGSSNVSVRVGDRPSGGTCR